MDAVVRLIAVTAENWREAADVEAAPEDHRFVAPVTRHLCLCHYGGVWRPLAVVAGDEVVGFVMWAVDPEDRSGWIGGLVIDHRRRRRRHARSAVLALLERLRREQGCPSAALSYAAANTAARSLYRALGFEETGEREGDELVARLPLAPA